MFDFRHLDRPWTAIEAGVIPEAEEERRIGAAGGTLLVGTDRDERNHDETGGGATAALLKNATNLEGSGPHVGARKKARAKKTTTLT